MLLVLRHGYIVAIAVARARATGGFLIHGTIIVSASVTQQRAYSGDQR